MLIVFLTRDSMLFRAVCLSVRLSVTRVDQSKTVEAIGSCNFHHSSMTSFLLVNFTTKFRRERREWGRQMMRSWERGKKSTQFSANKSPYNAETEQDRTKVTTNRKSRALSIDTKIIDLGWPWSDKFKFSRNFALLRIFGRQQRLKEWSRPALLATELLRTESTFQLYTDYVDVAVGPTFVSEGRFSELCSII